jgi:hypothetical protein
MRDSQGTRRIWFRQDYRGWFLPATAFCAPTRKEHVNKLPGGLSDCGIHHRHMYYSLIFEIRSALG